MATDPSRKHAHAIWDLVRAGVTVEGYDVYLGEVNKADSELTFPYLVVWPPPANRGALTMAGYVGDITTVTQVTGAGRTVDEVLAVLDRAAAALHRKRPTITGRSCGLITQVPGTPGPPQPQKDPTTRTPAGEPIYFSFLQFSLFSTAA